MSSQWVNKFAIMRDLSLAQGCLPVDVAGAVGAGERPPTSSFKEDTEEDFYRQWVVGDGDFAAPDLGLIKDMLEMVKNQDSPNEKVDEGDIIQIVKLNPTVPEFTPKLNYKQDNAYFTPKPKHPQADLNSTSKTNYPKDNAYVTPHPSYTQDNAYVDTKPKYSQDYTCIDTKKLKAKKPRNAAVQSILHNINIPTLENKDTNEIKPSDAAARPTIDPKFHDKIVRWLHPPVPKTPSPTKKNGPMLDWNPTAMFKKKNAKSIPKPTQDFQENVSPNSYSCNKYVPSKTAEEYYKKFVQCSEMHRMVEENVWTKVERQMKEIDERRKAEAELFALSRALCEDLPLPNTETEGIDPIQQKLDFVWLPQHRHLMPGPCAVCQYKRDKDKQNTSTNIPDKLKNVEDPWWNWRDDQEKVDNNWRDKTTPDDESKDKHTPVTKNVDDLWKWRDDHEEKVDDNETALTEDKNSAQPLLWRSKGDNRDEPWWAWIDDIKDENQNECIEPSGDYIVITKMPNTVEIETVNETNNNEHIDDIDENIFTKVSDDITHEIIRKPIELRTQNETVPANDYMKTAKGPNTYRTGNDDDDDEVKHKQMGSTNDFIGENPNIYSSGAYYDFPTKNIVSTNDYKDNVSRSDYNYKDLVSTNKYKDLIYANNLNENVSRNDNKQIVSANDFNGVVSAIDYKKVVSTNDCKEMVSTNDYQCLVSTNDYQDFVSTNNNKDLDCTNDFKENVSGNDNKQTVSTNDFTGQNPNKDTVSTNDYKEVDFTNDCKDVVSTNDYQGFVSTNDYQDSLSTNNYKDLVSTNDFKENVYGNDNKQTISAHDFIEENPNKDTVSTNDFKEAVSTNDYKDLISTNGFTVENQNKCTVSINDSQKNEKGPEDDQEWWTLADDCDDIDAWRSEILC